MNGWVVIGLLGGAFGLGMLVLNVLDESTRRRIERADAAARERVRIREENKERVAAVFGEIEIVQLGYKEGGFRYRVTIGDRRWKTNGQAVAILRRAQEAGNLDDIHVLLTTFGDPKPAKPRCS